MARPPVDRYDLAVLTVSILILAVVYAPPITSHIVRVAGWLTVATIYVGWMGFFIWKWVFDVEL
ncbi:hypothetical protein [Halovenus marina]|uniref:hypothetical protein n=1 Tax=Halovenus marina TaxID=3396621 RepID=UPI003F57BE0A